MIRFPFLLLLPFGLLAGAAPVEALKFTSSFDPIKIEARPGERVSRSFQLHLAADQPGARFRAHVEDWWQSEDGARSFYRPPGTLSRSCGTWVSLNPVESSVPSGGTLDVRMTAALPAGLAAGGYWCVLTVDELPEAAAEGPGVRVQFLASVSVGIFIDVAPVERGAEIGGVDLVGDDLTLRLRNTGNAPVGIEGRVELRPVGAEQPAVTVTVPRTTLLTEPVSSRSVKVALPGPELQAGRYLATVILDFGADHYIGAQKVVEIRHVGGKAPAR